jgi:hypothetical protein
LQKSGFKENQIGTGIYSIRRNLLSSEYYRNWVDEGLKNGWNQRDAKWTETIHIETVATTPGSPRLTRFSQLGRNWGGEH